MDRLTSVNTGGNCYTIVLELLSEQFLMCGQPSCAPFLSIRGCLSVAPITCRFPALSKG